LPGFIHPRRQQDTLLDGFSFFTLFPDPHLNFRYGCLLDLAEDFLLICEGSWGMSSIAKSSMRVFITMSPKSVFLTQEFLLGFSPY
jgi:hypothetical protein